MTKPEAMELLESLTMTHSNLSDHLLEWGPDSDPDYRYHSESDGPYPGDMTYEFAMVLFKQIFKAVPEMARTKKYKYFFRKLTEYEVVFKAMEVFWKAEVPRRKARS